jgi:hypothetical protein
MFNYDAGLRFDQIKAYGLIAYQGRAGCFARNDVFTFESFRAHILTSPIKAASIACSSGRILKLIFLISL